MNDHLAADFGGEGPFSGLFKKIWRRGLWAEGSFSEIWWAIFVEPKACTHFVRNFVDTLRRIWWGIFVVKIFSLRQLQKEINKQNTYILETTTASR